MMTAPDDEEIRRLKRTSALAGLLTLIGAVVVLSVFGFSAWQLNALEKRKAALKVEIAELEDRSEALQKWGEIAVRNAEAQSVISQRALEETRKLPGGSQTASTILTRAPIEAVARPRASADAISSGLYDFKLWLELPRERQPEVASVSYYFAHPSFADKVKESSDAVEDYQVGYRGWGALREVIITIHLNDGRSAKLAFDMADAINNSRLPRQHDPSTTVPTKGDLPVKDIKEVPVKGDIPVREDAPPEKVPIK